MSWYEGCNPDSDPLAPETEQKKQNKRSYLSPDTLT